MAAVLHDRFPCCGKRARSLPAGGTVWRECNNPRCAADEAGGHRRKYMVRVTASETGASERVGRTVWVAKWNEVTGR